MSRPARRSYAAALVLVAAGGAAVLVAAQAPWVRTTTTGLGAGPAVHLVVEAKGTEVAGAVVALGLLALAGLLAVVATRGWLRRAVGVLVALAGLGSAVLAARVLADPARAVAGGTLAPAGAAPDHSVTAWPWLAVLGGLAVVTGGVLVVWLGGRWAAMSARYDAPAPRTGERPGDAWAALDRGEDPTVDASTDASPGPAAEKDLP